MHRTTLVPSSLRQTETRHAKIWKTRIWQALLVAALATLAATRISPCQAQDPLLPIVGIQVGEFRQVQMSKKQNIKFARVENPKVVRLFSDPVLANVVQ